MDEKFIVDVSGPGLHYWANLTAAQALALLKWCAQKTKAPEGKRLEGGG